MGFIVTFAMGHSMTFSADEARFNIDPNSVVLTVFDGKGRGIPLPSGTLGLGQRGLAGGSLVERATRTVTRIVPYPSGSRALVEGSCPLPPVAPERRQYSRNPSCHCPFHEDTRRRV